MSTETTTDEVIVSDEDLFRVTTDLEDYAPGSTAIITAEGVDVGGSVTFEVEHVTDPGEDGIYGTADDTTVVLDGDGHDSWTVVDGGEGDLDGEANGVIVTSWYVNPDDSLDETFLLSADDGTDVVYDSFTDSYLAVSSLSFTPEAPTSGSDSHSGVVTSTSLDLTATDSPTIVDTVSGAIWTNNVFGAGTGVIDPFLRIQSNGDQDGVNTSGDINNDEKAQANGYTSDLLLSDVGLFNASTSDVLDGVGATGNFYEFRLDINENSNNNGDQYISLDDVMIFVSDTALLTLPGGTNVIDLLASDVELLLEGSQSGANVELVYDLDAQGDTWAALNYDLQAGSGVGDIALYIEQGDFEAARSLLGTDTDATYVYLVSSMGYQGTGTAAALTADDTYDPNGGTQQAKWQTSDGFEEWSILKGATLPGSIEGYKYEDIDGDGIKDAEDTGIPTWYIYLYIDDGDGVFDADDVFDGSGNSETTQYEFADYATQTVSTDGMVGYYNFAGLDPNLNYWIVEASATPGTEGEWVNTNANVVTLGDFDYIVQPAVASPGAGDVYGDDAGETTDFLNFDLFDLSGTKYEDMDGDGVIDAEDTGWGGVTIFIDQNDNQTLDDGERSTTTNADGSWSMTGLDASYAGGVVMEEVPDGSYQTFGNAGYTVTGTSGADQTGLDFANTKYGKITVTKYIDADGDLGTDNDQTVKAGWSIGLFGADDVQIGESVDTDASGVVVFDNLAPGTYTVKEATPEGWKVLGDAEVTLSGLESGFVETVDFYNFELFDLSGTKYEDMDGDGDMTDADPGWGGVTIFIDQNDNQTLDDGERSTTTNVDGSWSMTGLDASYAGGVVMEEVPDGSYQTFGNAGYTVTGTSGADQTGLDFANTKYGKITVTKYIDADGDLGTDNDQTVKAGWSIGLFGADDVQIGESVDTDASGVVVFDNLAPGTYTVKEATPEGWKVLGDAEVTLSGLESGFVETVDFYNFELFDLSGTKYEDMDGDGDMADADPGWGGVTIFIDQNDNQTLDAGERSTTTNADGSWSMTGLDASYAGGVVMEVVPEGSYQTYGTAGYTVTGTSGADQTGLDFANTRYGSIEGYKFFDVSRDGTWDADEVGALGWTIELYLDDGNGAFGAEDGAAIQTHVSDADGFWSFSGLEMGTYYVKEVMKAGWVQSTPEMNGDGYFKVVVDESGAVVISAVDPDGTLPNDGMLYFGNDMIDGPGVRTPGFWKSDLGRTYWDGDDTNEGMVAGTGVDFQKEGDEFAENDLFELNYPAYFDGLDADGGINFTPDAETDGAYPTYKEKGEDLPYLLVGDWNFNTVEDGEETVRELTLADALIDLEGGEDTKGKNTDYAKVSTVERDLVASWLNYMSGNAVDTEVEGQTIGYWIDQAILYVEHADGKTRKDGKTEWTDGVDIDGDDIIDTEAGSDIHVVLDTWNNWGVLAGEQITFDADDGQDLTSQAYYDAVA